MSYICEHCNKLVEDNAAFGSGRFCSRACANARKHSVTTKAKIKQSINKQTVCYCSYCGKEFNTLTAKASHERLCQKNPNKLINPKIKHLGDAPRFVVLRRNDNGIKVHTKLDITIDELECYKQTHQVCEICGRTIDEATKWDSKYAAKSLCIDHDHVTNKFRGLLCQSCNTKLGWYEKYSKDIFKYLNK